MELYVNILGEKSTVTILIKIKNVFLQLFCKCLFEIYNIFILNN